MNDDELDREVARALHKTFPEPSDVAMHVPEERPPRMRRTAAILGAVAAVAIISVVGSVIYVTSRHNAAPGPGSTTSPTAAANTTSAPTSSVLTSPAPTRSTRTSTAPTSSAPTGSAPTRSVPTSSAAASSAPAVTSCKAADLSLAVVNRSAGASTQINVISLTNTARAACSLSGYPVVKAFNESGAALNVPMSNTASWPNGNVPIATVTLQPGKSAGVYLERDTVPNSSCSPAPNSYIRMQVPGDSALTVRANVNILFCTGPVAVSPFLATTSFPTP